MRSPADPRLRRLVRPALLILAGVPVVAALLPTVRSRPGAASSAEPLPSAHAVRVRRGDVTLVYDKRESYVVAKAAELFPNSVCPLVPAHHVERDGVVHATDPAWTFPWWRANDPGPE